MKFRTIAMAAAAAALVALTSGCADKLTAEERAGMTPDEIKAEQAERSRIAAALREGLVTAAITAVAQWNDAGVNYVDATPEQRAKIVVACSTLTGLIAAVQAHKAEVEYPGLTDDVRATCDVVLAVADERRDVEAGPAAPAS